MAFFKFPLPGRKRGDDKAPAAVKSESIEAMRQRAKHRLIGAAVLVAIGVVGFPLVFDTQPRPIAVDIPIEIPDKNQVKPLVIPAPPPAAAPTVGAAAVNPPAPATASGPAAQVPAPASLGAKEEVVADTPAPQPEPKVEKAPSAPVAKAQIKTEPKPAPKPEAKTAARAGDGAKAEALLDGKTAAATPAASEAGRFVVQVGAFADASKAHEARQKVEKTGLKTYTQVVETKDGKRIRVRVGPFGSRAEADKAAGKIKGLELPAAILTL
ncbi:SPOR domain-containing protein [Polaromonas sp. C04]|uniref:SPOR domain-containing protein n=1 Tax=Polaromonas sp. C04 TaxID=1945857 RepID=UPI0009871983|nr:SPOR domain-containing protein [Polaromonas sp. C04]OOG60599.1 sporulation protein [Polaromonas sp. C04]